MNLRLAPDRILALGSREPGKTGSGSEVGGPTWLAYTVYGNPCATVSDQPADAGQDSGYQGAP
jgi:hypothetical protein